MDGWMDGWDGMGWMDGMDGMDGLDGWMDGIDRLIDQILLGVPVVLD